MGSKIRTRFVMSTIYNICSESGPCQDNSTRNNSDWGRGIEELAADFEATGTRARERFYGRYWKMSSSAAKSIFQTRGWQSDIHHDAEDVASVVVMVLARQEARQSGVFGPNPATGGIRTGRDLRGYLSRAIWVGCKQRIGALQRKRMLPLATFAEVGLKCDVADRCAADPALRIDIEAAVANLKRDQRGHYRKLPAGVTPLDLVMDVGLGDALLAGVPVRTIQRYTTQVRQYLAGSIGCDLGERKVPRTKRRKEPRMGM